MSIFKIFVLIKTEQRDGQISLKPKIFLFSYWFQGVPRGNNYVYPKILLTTTAHKVVFAERFYSISHS